MKKLVLAAMLAASFSANADNIYFGGLTYHLDRDKDYNEINPALIYENKDGWTFGAFENSYYNTTVVAGRQFSTERDDIRIGALVGLFKGYTQDQLIGLCSGNICFTAAPMLTYTKYDIQPTIVYGGTFFSLMIGYKF